jgi:hypothetical protein
MPRVDHFASFWMHCPIPETIRDAGGIGIVLSSASGFQLRRHVVTYPEERVLKPEYVARHRPLGAGAKDPQQSDVLDPATGSICVKL